MITIANKYLWSKQYTDNRFKKQVSENRSSVNIRIHEVFLPLELYIVTDWFCYWTILTIYHEFTCYWTAKSTHRIEIICRLQLWEKPKSEFAYGESTEERNTDWRSNNIISNNGILNTTRVPQSSAWIFYCLVRISSSCILSFQKNMK